MTPEYAVLFMLSLALAAVGAARLAIAARIRADLRRSERELPPIAKPARPLAPSAPAPSPPQPRMRPLCSRACVAPASMTTPGSAPTLSVRAIE
ncbi:MAG: hypothetical protein JSR82_21780 [Verrucomicrobia bacterium]|nr:hypothetical protein [Verrucomicrobiota bacterium]